MLRGEDPDELDALARTYLDDLRPRGALEQDLVRRIVGVAWRLRRVARAEEAMWQADDEDRVHTAEIRTHVRGMFNAPTAPWESDEAPEPRPGAGFIAQQFAQQRTSPLERLAAYEQRLGRAFHAAIRELNTLRKLRSSRDDDDDGAPARDDMPSAQNKPTESDASHPINSPEVDAAPDDARTTSSDAPDGTEECIEKNKPTARSGRFSDPGASEGAFDVERHDTHPPSP